MRASLFANATQTTLRWARLLMPSSFCRPPVEYSRGTRPSQAANSRPLPNAAPLPIAAISAVAVTGPMPGIASRRRHASLSCAVIHSVKGGEADVVFLFPDVSPAGDAAYQKHGPQRDSVIRLFYVGMTRARHTLYICQRESPMAVTI